MFLLLVQIALIMAARRQPIGPAHIVNQATVIPFEMTQREVPMQEFAVNCMQTRKVETL